MNPADLRTCEGGRWWHDGSEERAAHEQGRKVRPCPTCAADKRAMDAFQLGRRDGMELALKAVQAHTSQLLDKVPDGPA